LEDAATQADHLAGQQVAVLLFDSIDFAVVRESDRRPDEDREDSRDHSCTTPRRHDGHGITRADEPRRSMIFRSVFCS